MPPKKRDIGRHPNRKKQKQMAQDPAHVARKKDLQAERVAAAEVARCFGSPAPQDVVEPATEQLRPPPPKRQKGINEHRRRHAIHELFVNLGEPGESSWRGKGGAVSEIRNALRLPAGADAAIHKVLQRIVAEGDDFHAGRKSGGGRHAKLSLAEAMIAADELESGVGQTQATVSVNTWRGKQIDNRHGRRAIRFVPHKDCDESVRVKQEKWAGYAQYSAVPLP